MRDDLEPTKKLSAVEFEYWKERLAEPELVKRAVLLDVEANQEPFAVPVGKLRKGGHIEFLKKREAEKAFKLLSGKEGFPNLQVITCRDPLTGKPMRYYELRWGDPPPFNGCDWSDPICTLLLGVHYGYRVRQSRTWWRATRRDLGEYSTAQRFSRSLRQLNTPSNQRATIGVDVRAVPAARS